jgi:molecular chaperone DnaK
LKDKSTGAYPEELFAEFVREDGAWSSPKKIISDKKAALVEVELIESRSNAFNINIYDSQGNRIDCEPNQITILQGIGGLDGMQVLPNHICIVKHFADEEKDLIFPVKGLEKNNRYPAVGVANGLKTRQKIRPGMTKDLIRIPIYEGEYASQKTNPDLNNLVFEVVITGESLPALLPENSDVDITIKVDKSGLMKFSAYFPVLDHTEELEIPVKQISAPEASELTKKINNAKRTAQKVNASNISERLGTLEQQLEHEKGNADGRMKIMDGLRKELLQLETLEKATEFPKVEQELKDAYFELEDLVRQIKNFGDSDKINMPQIDNMLSEMKQKIDSIVREKNIGEAKELTQELNSLSFNLRNKVTGGDMDVQFLQHFNQNFNQFTWKNPTKARQLINQGLQQVSAGNKNIRPILLEIIQLIPRDELPTETLG